MTFPHTPLGRPAFGLLHHTLNTRTQPRGDNYTVDGASFTWSWHFEVVHGTVLRMIVDLGDLSRSMGVLIPGQSEHLGPPSRGSVGDGGKGGYHPILFGRAAVEAGAAARRALGS